MEEASALITNDAVVLGMLTVILALVFWTATYGGAGWKKFYSVVPSLLLCYFLPSLLSTFGLVDPDASSLYFVASRYLLPASLALLILSLDLPAVLRLGPKALIMFGTGTVGIVLGGPLAILIVSTFAPEWVGGHGPDAVWRGLTTVAGSWIGGGANQAAMKEVFSVGDDVFSALIAVDVIVANIWMACLLVAAGRSREIDARTGADASAVDEVRRRAEEYQEQVARMPKLADTMILVAVGCGLAAIGHIGADLITPWLGGLADTSPDLHQFLDRIGVTSGFFWLIVIATALGLIASFTRARELEGVGASRIGSAFLYILVATIGLKMDLTAIYHYWQLFIVGAIWLGFHAVLLIVVGRVIKAPVFFLAVGSQANVGGAASAPIVAAAFHPALAPVGVLLAILGYFLGTYCAWLCGILMQGVAPV